MAISFLHLPAFSLHRASSKCSRPEEVDFIPYPKVHEKALTQETSHIWDRNSRVNIGAIKIRCVFYLLHSKEFPKQKPLCEINSIFIML